MPLGSAFHAALNMGGGGAGGTPAPSGWNLSGASYDSVTFSVSSQEATPTGLAFRDNGTTMFVAGSTTNRVFQYSLSTAWDISTASYANKSYLWGSTGLSGLNLDPNGVYMIATFQATSSNVRTVRLDTANDLGSVTSWNNLTISAQDTNPRGVFIGNSNGKFYTAGDTGDSIYQYDITTNGYDGIRSGNITYEKSFSVSGTAVNPNDIFFSSAGTTMFVLSNNGASSKVQSYTLSTAWDIATATASTSFAVNSQTTTPTDFFFRPNGLKMYIVSSNATIYQYSLT